MTAHLASKVIAWLWIKLWHEFWSPTDGFVQQALQFYDAHQLHNVCVMKASAGVVSSRSRNHDAAKQRLSSRIPDVDRSLRWDYISGQYEKGFANGMNRLERSTPGWRNENEACWWWCTSA
jgi:hypothetical protein